MSTSKVTKAEFNREWESPHGMLYYHDIEFEDGTKGQYASKSKDQTKFVVGQSAEYEIAGQDKGGHNKIKPVKQEFGGGRRKVNVSAINGSVAVALATDLYIYDQSIEAIDMEKHFFEKLQKASALGEQEGIAAAVAYKDAVKQAVGDLISINDIDKVAVATWKRLQEYSKYCLTN